MKKLKRPELQRKEVSMKGFAKGRKKAVFHFWTKSRIKDFTEKRVAFRAKRRERKTHDLPQYFPAIAGFNRICQHRHM